MITVSITLHLENTPPFLCAMKLPMGTTVSDALIQLKKQNNALNLSNKTIISIDHQRVTGNTQLKNQDRLAIHQPLCITPEARRQLRIAIKNKKTH
jgi:putative ubiquitin-RnfH superfamily antitoxin RatB of RatAB toxin-antitoxin module